MQGEFISKLIFKVLDANFYPGTHLIKFHIWKGKRQITNKQTNKNLIWLEQKNTVPFWNLEARKPFPNTISVYQFTA